MYMRLFTVTAFCFTKPSFACINELITEKITEKREKLQLDRVPSLEEELEESMKE
jgi:hypothetical protein